jgi:hypothetical protein
MIVIFGLIILVAAVVVGVAGVLGNDGSGHALVHPFAVFGYHVTGSAGSLFLYGIVIGMIGLAGLSLLLASARRTSRRGSAARHSLRQSRRETAAVSRERDDLTGQRDTARAHTASGPGPGEARWGRLHLPGRRPAPQQDSAGPPEPPTSHAVPADAPAP